MLEPFLEELQVLGGDLRRDFKIHGGIIRLWGVLLAVVADTLASNMLGNKKSVSGAKRKCYHCMADLKVSVYRRKKIYPS